MPSEIPGIQRLQVEGRRPLVPPGVRIYAVGDVHGRLDLLNQLLARIADDTSSRPVVRPVSIFLGDYIDRGPSSRETIDRLIEHAGANESVFLKGNHEQIAISCLRDRGLFERWMRLGGLETLMSYGIAPEGRSDDRQIVRLQAAFHDALPQSHFRFFRDLQSSFALGDYFFAHAGVKPDIPLMHQKESDLLWIRQEFLSSRADFGKIIVHGHTPVLDVEVAPNRINIDTGAYATGRLSCLVIDATSWSLIDTHGHAREPAVP